jgi:hypothetical protein
MPPVMGSPPYSRLAESITVKQSSDDRVAGFFDRFFTSASTPAHRVPSFGLTNSLLGFCGSCTP